MFILKAEIPAELADALEAHFCEEGLLSWGIEFAPNGPLFLKGFFESEAEADEGLAALRITFPALPAYFAGEQIEDREWQEAYKEFLKPWSNGRLHWVPAWERESYVVPEGHVALYLDAGMAFGTGSHETTRLMARRLMDFAQTRGDAYAQQRIIDAGCGSGILALSAVLLGAKSVYGFDQDPEAIRVSRENTLTNGIAPEAVSFAEAGIESGLEGRQADFMMANIQADILKIHAAGLFAAMAPHGTLALSGILSRELDEVREHFNFAATEAGITCRADSRIDGEWADLCLFL
ncbi:50S ribosomal protein L11 methyltransferase [Ruficoccus amylovorans]|uniref:Ribosomal protein L11 methyltransferase n=1 Tax=Ruficoccus amylovorans TaxID=1804625 RepID=A0A842HII4_9BACT|nr:50S ribosomal protein L11 methyltransferase [Ruficoccus amylovorans]MBC2596323.1 50S ribosomal protein L11 methyltransferase [Ruficoccus amylovorans]